MIGNLFNRLGVAAAFFSLAFLLSGCPPKQKKLPAAETPAETPAETSDQNAAPGDLEIGSDWATAPGFLAAVRFDTDKSELSSESRDTLKSNAAVLKAALAAGSGVRVRVEGHCDERGTLEYNLALGQRRANIVKDYYAGLGIPKSKIETISYGEEKPVCSESNEGCWGQNRRGETTLKSGAGPIRIPADKLKPANP
jgi:peptidoglycan-associated lipoprotein